MSWPDDDMQTDPTATRPTKHRVTLYALTMPPSPMLYRDFERRSDAMIWRDWAMRELPCPDEPGRLNETLQSWGTLKRRIQMGDRCYLELRLRGRIETVAAFEEIATLLEENCWQVNDFNPTTGKTQTIREAMASGEEATFYLSECNYANIDEEESALEERGIAYEVSHEAGGSYPACVWSWSPERGKVESMRAQGQGAVVAVADLEKALKEADPLAAVRALVGEGNEAEGHGLPGYSLSDEVRLHVGLPIGVPSANTVEGA
jgi:hypothetical protein